MMEGEKRRWKGEKVDGRGKKRMELEKMMEQEKRWKGKKRMEGEKEDGREKKRTEGRIKEDGTEEED